MPAISPCASLTGRSVAVCAVLLAATTASAQTATFAALNWDGFSAGPRAQDYPKVMNEFDIYVLEDFVTDSPWFVETFSCTGAAPRPGTTGVIASILDALPPDGRVVMQTPPGGRYIDAFPWGRYEVSFDGQRLEPGSYWIMWAVQGNPDSILPVMFVSRGVHDVGGGVPDNALQYNPGLAWNLPGGALDPVTEGFNNEGPPVGVNFTLRGEPAPEECRVDFNEDGQVNSQDFFEFLVAFFAEDPGADFNDDGSVNSQDLFDFLALFFEGCD